MPLDIGHFVFAGIVGGFTDLQLHAGSTTQMGFDATI
jgi:hypothetical protein